MALGSGESLAVDFAKRFRQLENNRTTWEMHWQEIAELVIPRHDDFFRVSRDSTKGEKRTEKLFDSTAPLALERFAATMESMLTPRTQKWHSLRATDKSLNRIADVQEWFATAEEVLFAERYSPTANFASQMHEVYLSLGAFGSGAMFIDEEIGVGMRYKNIHLGNMYFVENHQGIIDTVFRRMMLTAKQAMDKFDPKLMPSNRGVTAAISAVVDKEPDKEFEFIQVVMPKADAKNLTGNFDKFNYVSYYVEVGQYRIVRQSGYRKFPYGVSRYVVAPDEVYGRAPAMTVLPDIKTLNQMEKTTLRAAHLAVNPPMLAHDDGVLSELSMKPGAINFGGVDRNGNQLVKPLVSGGNLTIGEDQKDRKRKIINDAFLVTLFQILVDTPRMTATEVAERSQEKGSLLSPTMGRQQSEMLSPIIDRELDILIGAGKLPPMPDALIEAEGDYQIEYDSPLSRAQRAEEVAGIMRTMETVTPFAQINPAIMDIFNTDEIARVAAEVHGMPFRTINSEDNIAGTRDQRAAAQAEASQQQQAQPAATAMKDMAEAAEIVNDLG